MRSRLFGRILPVYLISFSIGVTLVTAAFAALYVVSIRTQHLEDLTTYASLLSAATEPGDMERIEQLVSASDTSRRNLQVALIGPDGRVSAIAGSALSVPLPDFEPPLDELAPSGHLRGSSGLLFSYALLPDGDDGSYLVVTRSSGGISSRVRTSAFVVVAAAASLVVLNAFTLRRFARLVVAPIRHIQDAARSFSSGELSFRLDPEGPAELRTLAEDLNQMASELKERITAISMQHNQLETILSSMVEGVLVLDEQRRIVSMNNAAGRLLQVSPSGAAGKSVLRHVRVAQLDEVTDAVLASDRPVERTVTVYRDAPVHLQVHATRMVSEIGGVAGGVLIVLNDVSRITQLEELRTDFVANVSHELKTPITSIKGFVETLLDEEDPGSENSQRFLRIVLDHTNRLNLIIEDLLSLSRLEQTDRAVAFVGCSLASIVDAVIETCRPKADAKEISIVRISDGPDTIYGNPNLLEQAILNLVENAVKYSDAKSEVTVDTCVREGTLTIGVKDTGPGIPHQELPRIFERFYRTDKARSREMGGTGLGLAIVKHIALAHNGEVTVESMPGQGSTFTMKIPQRPVGE